MTEPTHTPEEIEAAWNTAEKIEGFDPDETRIVWCDDSGAVIRKSQFNNMEHDGWLIDEQGRARGYKYQAREAAAPPPLPEGFQDPQQVSMNADRSDPAETSAYDAALAFEKKQFAKQQAEQAGLPQAAALFERLLALEERVAKQAADIEYLLSVKAP